MSFLKSKHAAADRQSILGTLDALQELQAKKHAAVNNLVQSLRVNGVQLTAALKPKVGH